MSNSQLDNASAIKQVVDKGRKVIGLQLIMTLLVAAAFFAGQGIHAAQGALFGGLVSVMTTLLLSYGVKRATVAAATNPGKSAAILYLSAAQRFLWVLVAFAFGLSILKLYPLGAFAGFAIAQIAYIISMYKLRN